METIVIIPPKAVALVNLYPPEHNSTYVKVLWPDDNGKPYYATDPSKSLIDGYPGNAFMTTDITKPPTVRIWIDLGSAKTVKRIYYENFHSNGNYTDRGVSTFTLQGSNNSYGEGNDINPYDDFGWTNLTTSQGSFDRHAIGSNAPDPKYIEVTNAIAYRYYGIKTGGNYAGGAVGYAGLRRIVLIGY